MLFYQMCDDYETFSNIFSPIFLDEEEDQGEPKSDDSFVLPCKFDSVKLIESSNNPFPTPNQQSKRSLYFTFPKKKNPFLSKDQDKVTYKAELVDSFCQTSDLEQFINQQEELNIGLERPAEHIEIINNLRIKKLLETDENLRIISKMNHSFFKDFFSPAVAHSMPHLPPSKQEQLIENFFRQINTLLE